MPHIEPIIRQLERRFKGKWRAVRQGFGWMWKGPNGMTVRTYSQLTPQYDGDDETCISVYIDNNGVTVGSHGFIY